MSLQNAVQKILTLSTAHVTEKTLDILGNDPAAYNIDSYEKRDADGSYGFFIYITDNYIPKEMPNDLKGVLSYAISRKCSVVCLDQDGPVTSHLPVYQHDDDDNIPCILVRTDGETIDYSSYESFREAYDKMTEEYKKWKDYSIDNNIFYDEFSHIDEDSACMQSDRQHILWRVIKLTHTKEG